MKIRISRTGRTPEKDEYIFDVKMVVGDEPLEEFVLLAKGDATEYAVSSIVTFLHFRAILYRRFLRHT